MNRNDTFLNTNLGDYRLQELIAVGGMARVYLGIDTRLERRAAIKVLELDQEWVDETIIQRFEREAKSVAALEHDNIITIYQYGQRDGAYFIAMQYIDGQDMRKLLKSYRKREEIMPIERGLNLMGQVAAALDFAHAAGIIHRDIKPSNILLTRDDKAILTDFGLVLRNTDNTMGTAFGTPRYIAPEQAIASQQAVPESDGYSLAIIMYEILTGATPFDGETPMEIALAHVSDMPDPPTKRKSDLPTEIDDVLMRALSKQPHERYPTATEFVNAVKAVFGDTPAVSISAGSPTTTAQPDNSTIVFDDSSETPDHTQPDKPAPANAAGVQDAPPEKIQSPIAPATVETPKAKKQGSPLPLLVGVVLLIAVIVGAFFFLNSPPADPDPQPEPEPTVEVIAVDDGADVIGSASIVLDYNDVSLLIHNTGDDPVIETVRLRFVRGEQDTTPFDDYAGDRIGNDTIPDEACVRIALSNAQADWMDSTHCATIHTDDLLLDRSRFFWGSGPEEFVTFEVYWDDALVTTCDTVRRGDEATCRFDLPILAPNS